MSMKIGFTGCRILYKNEKVITGSIIFDTESGTIEKIVEKSISKREVDILVELTRDYIILPGFIDIHVHCRDYELAYKETIETCSQAAAGAGVVLICDMPNTRPFINTPELIERRLRDGYRNSLVEYYLHAGVPEDADLLEEFHRLGVRSIKMFPEDYEKLKQSGKLEKFLNKLKLLDMLLVAHCEDLSIIRERESYIDKTFENHNKIRPEEAEIVAVKELLKECYRAGVRRVHITHVSSPRSLELIDRARSLIPYLTCDVTPHHMFLSQEECLTWCDFPGFCKVNPPLRDRETRGELLLKLLKGVVDCVVTDHAPHDIREKVESYEKCPPGISGIETGSLLLLELWRQELLTLNDIVRLYSQRPARIVRFREPKVEERYPAYFTIVNCGKGQVIQGRKFKSKAKFTPFEGVKVSITITLTVCRGRIVHLDLEDERMQKLQDIYREHVKRT